jgi:hypothetical protein
MRRGTLLLAAVVAACGGQGGSENAARRAGLAPRDSIDSVLATPPVVVKPTVVLFWLAASDSLLPDDAAAAYDELTLAAGGIVEALAAYEIELLPTHADTVYVELLNHRRQPIVLSGLEFPFGFVLIEPGSTERLLAGVYGEAELLDEIRVYFDLPEDSTRAPARVSTE